MLLIITKKGWTNRTFWAHSLDFLRKYISGNEDPLHAGKIYLICDSFRSHHPSENENGDVALALARKKSNL